MWKIIEQRRVPGPHLDVYAPARLQNFLFHPINNDIPSGWADILPLEPETFPTSPLERALFSAVKLAPHLNASINTEEGQLRCRVEQVEGEIELLSDEKIALIEAIARCGIARSGAVPSKP